MKKEKIMERNHASDTQGEITNKKLRKAMIRWTQYYGQVHNTCRFPSFPNTKFLQKPTFHIANTHTHTHTHTDTHTHAHTHTH